MDKPGPECMKALKELQALDMEIMLLEEKKKTLPAEMQELKIKISGLEKEISALESEIKALAMGRREKESALEDNLQVLEKLRSQKNMVSTNEAYTALLKEIGRAEQERTMVEEDILVYMERTDEILGLVEDKKSGLADCSSGMKILEEKNRARINELDVKLAVLYKARGEKEEKVAVDLLSRYERIKKAKGGLALAGVRGGLCQGCFMEVRLQVISELIKGELMTCDSCSRLLYWDGEQIECGQPQD